MKKHMIAIGATMIVAAGMISQGSSPLWAASLPVSASQAGRVDGKAAVNAALRYLGTRYVAHGTKPDTGFDDVGFVRWIYAQQGVNLPRSLTDLRATARNMHEVGLHPGHLIFFKNTVWSGLSHVGIYIGHGRFVHAEWYGRGVVISHLVNDSVDGSYWASHYLGKLKLAATPVGPGSPPLSAGDSVIVAVNKVDLRLGPSFLSPIAKVISLGTHLTVIASRRAWIGVNVADGGTGWILRQFVSVLPH